MAAAVAVAAPEATFGTIKVTDQDGSRELDIKDVPRAQRLENFKWRVAMELNRSERRYVNPDDIDLFVFSEKMEDKDRTLADYGLKDGAIVTRVDHFNGGGAKPRSQKTDTQTTTTTTDPVSSGDDNNQSNLPPYPGPPAKPLKSVFVKLAHRTITLEGLTTASTIQDVYEKLKHEAMVNQANTGLIFGSKELKPSYTLNDVDIGNESTIFIFDKLIGGSAGNGSCSRPW